MRKTTERLTPENFRSAGEYLMYLMHLFAYQLAADRLPHGSRLLEVGSGEGYGTFHLAGSGKFREITGLDVDRDSILRASSKYRSDNLTFQHYSGGTLPFGDNSFDAAVSFQVVEHIRDDRNYIDEVSRVLKQGGMFLVTTPNRTNRLKPGQKPWNRFHVREYDAESLGDLLSQGFGNVKIMGIRGTDEIQQIEALRIRDVVRLYSLDPLNLRKMVPPVVKSMVVRLFRSSGPGNTGGDEDFLPKYSLQDFRTVEGDLQSSLDLLGICIKE